MILPKGRDPRFITIRRGGTLTDSDHQFLAVWAAQCVEHVLHLFESAQPSDMRLRQTIEQARAWARGEITMSQSRAAACAIKAARAAAPEGEGTGLLECRWQREQLPDAIRDLVLDDQRLRNNICWSVFEC